MTPTIQDFINSIPEPRIKLALQEIFNRTLMPSGVDTAITAHAGGGQANAMALKPTVSFHEVTTVATAADSIRLPNAVVGEYHFVKNSAANAMQVFGSGTDTIDSVATGTGVSQLGGDAVLYACMVKGNYIRLGGVSAVEVFGAITVDSISSGDASLGVNGLAAAQGGDIALTGGTSSTAGNAGGAVTLTGGTPGSTGIGGAVTLTAGAGGSASNNGGVSSLIGGAGTAGNGVGGVSRVVGGAGQGSGAGGAAQVTAGAGGATGSGGAVTLTSGAGGATSGVSGDLTVATGTTTAGSGSATGAVTVQSGAGATSAVAVAGGASGAVTLRSQAGGANTGGATGQVGGAAGALSITGGAGGATNSTGAHAGGAGAAVSITAGAGGNASAGTGNGGAGGNVVITPGSGGTTTGGTAGVGGSIINRGLVAQTQGAPNAQTVAATLTIANLLTKIVTGTHAAGATQAYVLPTGTLTDAALQFSADDSFDWCLINLSAAAIDTITVTAGTDHTIVGNPIVQSAHSTTGGIYGNSSMWRTRKTAANTYVTYRIA